MSARARRLPLAALAAGLALALPARAGVIIIGIPLLEPTLTLRAVGTDGIGAPSVIATAPGASVELEVVLDSAGDSVEGYLYGVDWTNGAIGDLAVTRIASAQAPLVPDLFGPFEVVARGALGSSQIDTSLRNVNAASLTAGPGLAPGTYVLERISFTVEELPEEGIEVVPAYEAQDVFGLAGWVTLPDVYGVTLVPEPAGALGPVAALAALAALGRRRTRRPQARVDCSKIR